MSTTATPHAASPRASWRTWKADRRHGLMRSASPRGHAALQSLQVYRPPARRRGLAEMEDKRKSQYATWPMRGRAALWHSRDVTDWGRSTGHMGVGLSSGKRRRCGPGRPCGRSAGCGTAVWSSPGRTGTPCSMGPAVGGHPQGPWHPCVEQNPTSSRGHGGVGETPALLAPPLRQDSQILPRGLSSLETTGHV